MFDNVLQRGNVPRRNWGASSVIAVVFYVLVGGFAVWASARPAIRDAQDMMVKFVKPPPPPPPPPPPAPPKNRPKPKKVEKASADQPMVLQQAIIAPKEIPTDKPKESDLINSESKGLGEGFESGDVGNVAGGIKGTVVDAADAMAPVEFNESMTRPEKMSGPDPEYTQKAIEHEVQGLMVVKCVITIEGKIEDCRVLKSLPFMDRAVVSALERRRYKPVTLKGKPITVDYTFRINLILPQ